MSAPARPPVLCPRCGMSVDAADRFCRGCGAPLGAAASGHELRKTVSVVFCDLVGSTALGERLDAEALRHVLGRYYAEMRAVLERHGGLVEKFIGDAVVAVFGVPVVHEDDALRAVRAAVDMRLALDTLNEELERESGVRVGVRIGVNTGEVVAGDLGPGASFASGDAVNVAARLEQAAPADEILIGARTRALLGEAAEIEAVAPLDLHGKSEPVEAFRLLSVPADAEPIVRHFETVFVGRECELSVLEESFAEALAEPGCRLLTVLGEPGIGKTRLLREFAQSVAGRALVLSGGCLPYGEGITYWPLRELVHELCEGDDLAAELASHLAGSEQAERIAGSILGAIGATETAGSVEEVQWAARRLFESLAAERPLLILLEDLHWAEPTFLQLVEYVADCAGGAPIVLLAAAREELLDENPGWALPHPHSRLLPLEPLPDSVAGRLVDALAGAEPVAVAMREQVVGTGGGNPLFLEQLVALQAEDGNEDGELPLPTTVTALLAARLDRLPTAERDLLERAAVEGITFHRRPLAALLPDEQEGDVGALLLDAVRRNLIRSGQSQLPGDEGYQFVHVLVRDAVYEAMPKELRAQLHELFADWLEQRLGPPSSALEEILAYHLEQTVRLRDELGTPTRNELRDAARRHLVAAGRTAYVREDYVATVLWLERAIALRPEPPDVGLELELVEALVAVGRYVDAHARADTLAGRAAAVGDFVGELAARVKAGWLRAHLEPEGAVDELETLLEHALPQLESAGDDRLLCHAYAALADGIWNSRVQYDRAAETYERAAAHAARAGLPYSFLAWRSLFRLWGSWPLTRWLTWYDQQTDKRDSGLRIRHALALGLLGRTDEARAEFADVSADLADRGAPIWRAPFHATILESYVGDYEAALAAGRTAYEGIEPLGETAILSSVCANLAYASYETGRFNEAEAWATRAAELGPDDIGEQISLRHTRAKLLARQGNHMAAEALANEAILLADSTEAPVMQADARYELAEVLSLTGHADEARVALEDALTRYERKGVAVMAKRVRERLAALDGEHATRQPAAVGRSKR